MQQWYMDGDYCVCCKVHVHRVTLDGCAIGVKAVDCNGVAWQLTHKPLLAEVCLASTAHMIALGAANEAALTVPESGLSIAARAAWVRNVDTGSFETKPFLLCGGHHKGIDRITRSRVHHCAVTRRARREDNKHGDPQEHLRAAHLDGETMDFHWLVRLSENIKLEFQPLSRLRSVHHTTSSYTTFIRRVHAHQSPCKSYTVSPTPVALRADRALD